MQSLSFIYMPSWRVGLAAGCLACSAPTGPGGGEALPVQVDRLAAAGNVTCLLDGAGQPLCWGPPPALTGSPGGGFLRFRSISGGADHFCALSADSTAFCWGQNLYGQLGDGTRTARADPVPVASANRFIAIAAGVSSTCALDGVGRAFCWGSNEYGALGNGSRGEGQAGLSPTPVSSAVRFKALGAASTHCGISVDDRVYCWGMVSGSFDPDFYRAPGDCTNVYYLWSQGKPCLTPTPLGGTLRFLSLADSRCGVTTERDGYCWGDGFYGQLGNGKARFYSVAPVRVEVDFEVRSLVVGAAHACGLDMQGRAFCWGVNTGGQVGNGEDGAPLFIPVAVLDRVPVQTQERFVALATGYHTCGLTGSNSVWCWGPGYGNVPMLVVSIGP